MRLLTYTPLLAISLSPAIGDCSNFSKCSEVLFQTGRDPMVAEKNESNALSQILNEYLVNPENGRFELKGGQQLTATVGSDKDVEVVTKLIHEAFAIWKVDGLDLGPMHQTIEQTKGHLVGKGLVLRDRDQIAVGTVSFDIATIETISDHHLFYVDNQPLIPYRKLSNVDLNNHRFLIIKRIATHPGISRSGLGTSVLRFAENLALALNLDGVALETVKETQWLYDWYTHKNYLTIGTYQYPSRPIETVLKVKTFGDVRC